MLNEVNLIGRVGVQPEIKQLESGNVANFSIATNEHWKDKDGVKQERTEWHNISIFGKLSDIVARYVNTGDLIYLKGKIRTRKYIDQNGVEKYATNINCYEMKMLGGKKQEDKPEDGADNDKKFADFDEDIPF